MLSKLPAFSDAIDISDRENSIVANFRLSQSRTDAVPEVINTRQKSGALLAENIQFWTKFILS